MFSRIAAGMLVMALAGCANEPMAGSFPAPMGHLGATALSSQSLDPSALGTPDAPRKSVASKVLSAMAFEKVTGLKADPARLMEAE